MVYLFKIFDSFSDITKCYLLSYYIKQLKFKVVPENMYIDCFLLEADSIKLKLENKLLSILDNWKELNKNNNLYNIINLFSKINIDNNFVKNIKNINEYFTKSQTYIMNKTYSILEDDEFVKLIKIFYQYTKNKKKYIYQLKYFDSRIINSINYCKLYNIPLKEEYSIKYIEKCPHHNAVHEAENNLNDIKDVIINFKTDSDDPIILNKIYKYIWDSNLNLDLDLLLLEFKNKDTTLNPNIKKYLGHHICKYCYEPLYCKHYNLMPNLDEVINYYGIHDDHIDCFICGEYLDTIDEEIHEFTKDGNKIHRIQQEDLSYDNNKDDTNNNTLSEMIDNYYNIFIHKLHIKNDKLSLFTLILNYFNDNYFTSNKIRKDDIYIIYEYLYNDYINIIQNNVLNIIHQISEYNKFAILFKVIFI